MPVHSEWLSIVTVLHHDCWVVTGASWLDHGYAQCLYRDGCSDCCIVIATCLCQWLITSWKQACLNTVKAALLCRPGLQPCFGFSFPALPYGFLPEITRLPSSFGFRPGMCCWVSKIWCLKNLLLWTAKLTCLGQVSLPLSIFPTLIGFYMKSVALPIYSKY